MTKSQIIKTSFAAALAVGGYVAAVAALMNGMQSFFGPMPGVLGGTVILLLLVLSAAIVGSLIFGKPVLLYLDGEKKAGISLFLSTIGWLVLILTLLFVAILFLK